MCTRLIARLALCSVIAALLSNSQQAVAAVLTTATFDTDSYVFFGTNAVNSPEITLGEPTAVGEDPHFNIGFLKFDVTSLALAGSKYLELEPNTGTAVLPSKVRFSVLDSDVGGYFAAGDAPNRRAWLGDHAFNTPAIGTLSILPSGGKHYLDVTSTVNAWISNPSSNLGFAMWRVGGDGFDSPELYSMNDAQGRGPAINSVPEPSSLALCGVAAVSLLAAGWRRHRAGQSGQVCC